MRYSHFLLSFQTSPGQSEPPSTYDSKFLYGSVIVHCLSTTSVDTFNQYADKQLENSKRLDVVWDTYIPNSLKESTREKRDKGIRRKVSGNTKLLRNWMDFLRDSMNKTELFNFLTFKIVEFKWPPGKDIYVTSGKAVEQIGSNIPMKNCNHEEADERIVVHVLHSLQLGAKSILVRTVDTDVSSLLAHSIN
ncbi:hypothetical protein JTB14_032330 [Gonioctena quinquepunctata]|nr:hypothetical protein JTB14_032330 [Gonioctena quinquepunctata]